MPAKTPQEMLLELDLDKCRKHAQSLLEEKNLVARQLEILSDRLKLSVEERAQLRHEASQLTSNISH